MKYLFSSILKIMAGMINDNVMHNTDPPGSRNVAICNFSATSTSPRESRTPLQF